MMSSPFISLPSLVLLILINQIFAVEIESVFDVPLYLFESKVNNDTALLSRKPNGTILNGDSYKLIYDEPVLYGSSKKSSSADIALFSYWSQERRDLQASEWNLTKLNMHGGNYSSRGIIAWISSDPETTPLPRMQVPVLQTYSETRFDALTSPFNFADCNNLLNLTNANFVDKKRLLGFGGAGSCELCNTTTAAAYPSLGGADCPTVCAPGKSSFTAIYRVGKINNSTAADNFRASMLLAGKELSKYGKPDSTESGDKLHVSFEYLCCYTDDEKNTIRSVLSNIDWPDLNISFSSPVWRVDNSINPSSSDSRSHHYSIIVLLDDASNEKLQAWVAEVENKIRQKGIEIHVERKQQQPFHSTLGVVNGLEFPLETALKAVNAVVPPNTWTGLNGEQITLTVPDF